MEKQEQAKPVRGQNLLEWYEALISAAPARRTARTQRRVPRDRGICA